MTGSKAAAVLDRAAATDEGELAKFAALGASWWDPKGPMAPLHKMNPARVAFVRDEIGAALGRAVAEGPAPLAGVRVLDIGCGGGLLAEPLARLGAAVTGIDPLPASIEAARRHAHEVGLAIDYRVATVEAVIAGADGAAAYDAVIASEVVEHVPDVPAFLAAMAQAVRPGGVALLSTVNRTAASFLKAIVGAEYLLGWLPRGTHDWRRFLTPAEIARELRRCGLRPARVAGIAYDAARDSFALARGAATDTNYLMAARRDA